VTIWTFALLSTEHRIPAPNQARLIVDKRRLDFLLMLVRGFETKEIRPEMSRRRSLRGRIGRLCVAEGDSH
jgi:hypothetical protein